MEFAVIYFENTCIKNTTSKFQYNQSDKVGKKYHTFAVYYSIFKQI